jgi:cobalt-zinc-cadmium efflux system membrane fusion protein
MASGQSVVARTSVDNFDGRWRPGMTVAAEVIVNARQVPLAVKESGLQRFRDFTVVFARYGETYEVRMLELGARDGTYAEVLGGIKPGTPYVSEQSFLIKADVDKSGASHDH